MRKVSLLFVAIGAAALMSCTSSGPTAKSASAPEISSQKLGANEMFLVAEASYWPPVLTFCPNSIKLNALGECSSGEALRRAGGEGYVTNFLYTPEVVGARTGLFAKENEMFAVHKYVVPASRQTYFFASADGITNIRAKTGSYSFEAKPGALVILPKYRSSIPPEQLEAKVRALVPGAESYEVLKLVKSNQR